MSTVWTNATSVEVNGAATADISLHRVVAGSALNVTFVATYPADGAQESMKAYLYKTSDVSEFEDIMGPTNMYKMSLVSVSQGEAVNFTFTNVANDSYYCLVYDTPDQQAASSGDYWGAYGWTGTAEANEMMLALDVWNNMASFEVSGSDVDLGGISLHRIQ